MSAARLALAGAVGGLAWSASLRGYMAELVGSGSRVEWVGTFVQILLPGVLIGVALGLAEHLRRTGGRPGWRWLAVAPVLFPLVPLLAPGALVDLVTTGIGGAAIGVALIGVLGGFAVSERGPLWARILAGVPAALLIAGGSVAFFGFIGRDIGDGAARGVWVGLLFASLSIVFAFACSIPHRRVAAATAAARPADAERPAAARPAAARPATARLPTERPARARRPESEPAAPR